MHSPQYSACLKVQQKLMHLQREKFRLPLIYFSSSLLMVSHLHLIQQQVFYLVVIEPSKYPTKLS